MIYGVVCVCEFELFVSPRVQWLKIVWDARGDLRKAARSSGPRESRLNIWLFILSSRPAGLHGHSPASTRQYRHAHTQRNSAARWRHSFVTVWYVAISLRPPPAFPAILLFLLLCLPRGFVRLSILRHEGLFCKIQKKKISKAPDC